MVIIFKYIFFRVQLLLLPLSVANTQSERPEIKINRKRKITVVTRKYINKNVSRLVYHFSFRDWIYYDDSYPIVLPYLINKGKKLSSGKFMWRDEKNRQGFVYSKIDSALQFNKRPEKCIYYLIIILIREHSHIYYSVRHRFHSFCSTGSENIVLPFIYSIILLLMSKLRSVQG